MNKHREIKKKRIFRKRQNGAGKKSEKRGEKSRDEVVGNMKKNRLINP